MFGPEGFLAQALEIGLAAFSILMVGVFFCVNLWLIADQGKSVAFTLSGNAYRAHQRFVKDTRHRSPTDRDRRQAGQAFRPITYLYFFAVCVLVWQGVTGLLSWIPEPPGDGTPAQLLVAGSLVLFVPFVLFQIAEDLRCRARQHYLHHYVDGAKDEWRSLAFHLPPEVLSTIVPSIKSKITKLKDLPFDPYLRERRRLEIQASVDVLNDILERLDPKGLYEAEGSGARAR
jgi:hypothetical protein